MSTQEELFLWLDFETTGLDPDRCLPIEVAMVITGPDFKPRATFESLIDVNTDPTLSHWDQYAWRMHWANGLLTSLEELPVSNIVSVANLVRAWLAMNLGTKQANLAGSSVHFDRSFLRHLPGVEWFLTHRHLDVSAVRLAMKAIGGKDPDPKPETAHRALADVYASIAELKHWLSFVPGWHNVDAKEQFSSGRSLIP